MWSCQITDMQLWPAAHHEQYYQQVSTVQSWNMNVHYNYSTRMKMMQSSGCNQWQLQHLQNEITWTYSHRNNPENFTWKRWSSLTYLQIHSQYLQTQSHTCRFTNIPAHSVTYLQIQSHTCRLSHIPADSVTYLQTQSHTCRLSHIPADSITYLQIQ